jgi:hypothetical protein
LRPVWRRSKAAVCETALGNTRFELFAVNQTGKQYKEVRMGRSILLWLLGVPIPIIILIALLSR